MSKKEQEYKKVLWSTVYKIIRSEGSMECTLFYDEWIYDNISDAHEMRLLKSIIESEKQSIDIDNKLGLQRSDKALYREQKFLTVAEDRLKKLLYNKYMEL